MSEGERAFVITDEDREAWRQIAELWLGTGLALAAYFIFMWSVGS